MRSSTQLIGRGCFDTCEGHRLALALKIKPVLCVYSPLIPEGNCDVWRCVERTTNSWAIKLRQFSVCLRN